MLLSPFRGSTSLLLYEVGAKLGERGTLTLEQHDSKTDVQGDPKSNGLQDADKDPNIIPSLQASQQC